MKPRPAFFSAALLLLFTLGPAPDTAAAADGRAKPKVAEDTTADADTKAFDAADALRKAGKHAEAEAAFRALAAARTQALGAEARETLLARKELLKLELLRGKDATAEARMQELLPVLQRSKRGQGAKNQQMPQIRKEICLSEICTPFTHFHSFP